MPATPTPRWPAAPFSTKQLAATVYTNQNGDATVKKLRLPSSGFQAVGVFWDDPGPLDVTLTGKIDARLAYYNKDGQPARVGTDGHLTAEVPKTKAMFYLGVQSQTPASSGTRASGGTYGLEIDGPPLWLESIPINNTYWAGANGSDISDDGDTDVYAVKIPRTANWVFEAIPNKDKAPVDLTFNVFDSKGRPLAGNFTRPIDAAGAGGLERWTGVGLRKGQTYYFRVDGKGSTRGGYGVAVFIADVPDLAVTTRTPVIKESSTKGAAIVLSRSDPGADMTVRYRVLGTAANGKDYVKLTGKATIRSGWMSTSIFIKPVLDTEREADETVIVEVMPSAAYNPAIVSSVKLTLRNVGSKKR